VVLEKDGEDIWTDRVNNAAVLHRVKEGRNILHTIRRRKANWIGHILRRNYLIKHIIEGKILGTRRRGRRRKEEAQDRTLWRTQFRRGYGPVARQTNKYLTSTSIHKIEIPRPLSRATASNHSKVFPFTLLLSEEREGGAF
jgi:hypothetical protein